ncbi:Inter-alpha-trypsin inhibitor heavy chain H5 [Actinoplanes sp. SE50]|nr:MULTISPECIES: VWA domain-containing protein [unclassified Actinoplanes]AEV81549.1 Inter-alpha-trypsin inhibitor heavy chain H5 [Actinoplanes sp. SE50/110]ATO79951.1 Inter-alpha-trypsin inhibitor heavy chain H5 [Actinoplanes sp. SE50]SLL97353.1 inter-alpha-trypsin inhibitor heavy chain H5 [Actinoplanes sp. SE50/110]
MVAAGLIGAATLLGATPAHADETDPPRVELVLDVSGSMRAADIDGETRIAVAKRAFGKVVDALPADTRLGIRVLGATYAGKNRKVACQDTQQIVGVGPVSAVQAKNAIATLKPTGYTPIGLALRKAAADLGDSGSVRRIVLITDGEDTCTPPDPCEVARELAAQGTHLVIDTLGLTPDEKTRKQLVCISTATGGTYAAAKSEQELTDRVQQLVDRAVVPPPVKPAVVTGTAACAGAPLLAPGVYTDREQISQHRFYRVAVPPGQELRASVSIALDRAVNPDYGVLLTASTPGGRELVRGLDAGSGRTDVLSAGLRWAAEQGSEVCLTVSNSFATATTSPLGMPVELTIGLTGASHAPDAPGLGRGFLFLLVLAVAGLIAGILAGWATRYWVATWREN